jgi:exoribonuclease R
VKPGDVVEFKPGLFGLEPPRNIAVLADRWRRKGVSWVRLVTLDGEKEAKAEHLTRRAFRSRYDGDLKDTAAVLSRLRHLAGQHAAGSLAEEAEEDLGHLEQALWESTCDLGAEALAEEEVCKAHYGSATPQQLRDVRAALDRCRRAGTGRFQTVGGRGDRWRPWSRAEHDRMVAAWRDLQELRGKLVASVETEEGRMFQRVPIADASLTDRDTATLQWVKAAMVQFVDWDGVPDGQEPVAGIGGLGAVQAFGMDLHRALGFLAQDWIQSEHTTVSSDYVHFLLESGLWTPEDAVDGLIRRHVNQEEFFEHTEDARAEADAGRFPEPDIAQDPDRTDLRGIACWTIDPPDAKDFDDAVGIEDLGAGRLRLWVHVADVSHYVTPDSYLDRHAKRRATSVYLPGRVLPMLPHRVSDHLCSLRSDGDRFALSVGMDVEADGSISAWRFHKAMIRVTENLHYGEALRRAQAGEGAFPALLDLAQRMRSRRRGLELETGELKVLLEATGFSALEKRADDATRMIETFMVAANEAVARHMADAAVPLLYRCHPLPDRAKAERFAHQMETMGMPVAMALPAPRPGEGVQGGKAGPSADSLLEQLKAGGGKLNLFGGGVQMASKPAAAKAPEPPEPAEDAGKTAGFASLSTPEREAWLAPFRAAVERLAAERDEGLSEVATLKLLGCMGRAYYTPDNEGHFGLASTHYCHFTSPIRRYPDLVTHRNLKWLIAGRRGGSFPTGGSASGPPHTQESLRALCDHCSDQERAADGLERRIKASCLVLASLKGEGSGKARITGITPASLFVLRDDGIEARAAARDLPGGPYQVDEWESMLYLEERQAVERFGAQALKDLLASLDADTGESRRVRARLGDRVTVRLAGRDVASGRTGAVLTGWG